MIAKCWCDCDTKADSSAPEITVYIQNMFSEAVAATLIDLLAAGLRLQSTSKNIQQVYTIGSFYKGIN